MQAIKPGALSDRLYDLVARINRQSQITLTFAQCDGTAGWSRNGRRIWICDNDIRRIETQARTAR